MFSRPSFVRRVTTMVISALLAVVAISPKSNSATVQAAAEQPGAIPQARSGSARGVSKPRTLDKGAHLQPEISVSSGKPRQAESWQSWPILPSLSPTALSIYRKGLALGNNPRAFSKIGDGEISAAWFLTEFDRDPSSYDLGAYAGLQSTINYFAGSFGRQGAAAHRGFNAQRVLDPTFADAQLCQPNETPLDCEIRLHHPSFALISMGTNQVWQPQEFERGMRVIIETLLHRGVVPILSTKADNLEGDSRINFTIARLAVEYDLPLWNFWLAVQPLPEHGLQEDREHLTYYPNDFSAPGAMQYAWPVRNLSALRVLEQMMLEAQP